MYAHHVNYLDANPARSAELHHYLLDARRSTLNSHDQLIISV